MSVDSDLAAMLSGWDNKKVQLGEFDGFGILDEQDDLDADATGDPVLRRVTLLKLRRSDFLDGSGLLTVSRGDTVSVDGVDYSISDLWLGSANGRLGGEEVDGRELHLVIRKV